MTAWMIRAGREGVHAADWLNRGVIGINWDYDGQDIAKMSRDDLKSAYGRANPAAAPRKVASAAGQSYRFAHDMTEGSTVVLYDPSDRRYHIGKITGPCVPVNDGDDIAYSRTVEWVSDKSRDELSDAAKNSLGSIRTIFKVSDETLQELESTKPATESDDQETDDAAEQTSDATYASYDDGIERIKDRILKLDWEDMERLTAGLLTALGYHARITAKGPDGGRDVIASPDPLGVEPPRIIAEVKHRQQAMDASAIRSFLGGLRAGDHGLYVSTGGFTREARYEADRANNPIRLMNLDEFARLYAESYDRMDTESRSILPLIRIWLPV